MIRTYLKLGIVFLCCLAQAYADGLITIPDFGQNNEADFSEMMELSRNIAAGIAGVVLIVGSASATISYYTNDAQEGKEKVKNIMIGTVAAAIIFGVAAGILNAFS